MSKKTPIRELTVKQTKTALEEKMAMHVRFESLYIS